MVPRSTGLNAAARERSQARAAATRAAGRLDARGAFNQGDDAGVTFLQQQPMPMKAGP